MLLRYPGKNKLVIHCSYTTARMNIGAKDIERWHTAPPPQGNGWVAIGYAFVIRRDGGLELGRDLDGDGDVVEETGAHVAYNNKNTVGICLVGGKGARGRGENNFTAEQFKTLAWLLKELTALIPGAEILGHRDFPGVTKECPCFDVRAWVAGGMQERTNAA